MSCVGGMLKTLPVLEYGGRGGRSDLEAECDRRNGERERRTVERDDGGMRTHLVSSPHRLLTLVSSHSHFHFQRYSTPSDPPLPPLFRSSLRNGTKRIFHLQFVARMASSYRVSLYLFAFLLLQCVTLELEFSECTTEEQAIDWVRAKIENNEKIDKNTISIVAIVLHA